MFSIRREVEKFLGISRDDYIRMANEWDHGEADRLFEQFKDDLPSGYRVGHHDKNLCANAKFSEGNVLPNWLVPLQGHINDFSKPEVFHRQIPKLRIMDFGCGCAALPLTTILSLGTQFTPDCFEFHGIDYSISNIRFIQHIMTKYSIAGRIWDADEFEYHVINGSMLPDLFDVILCANTLEHVYDPMRYLEFLDSKLQRGGLLLMFVPGARGNWHIDESMDEYHSKAPQFLQERYTELGAFFWRKN